VVDEEDAEEEDLAEVEAEVEAEVTMEVGNMVGEEAMAEEAVGVPTIETSGEMVRGTSIVGMIDSTAVMSMEEEVVAEIGMRAAADQGVSVAVGHNNETEIKAMSGEVLLHQSHWRIEQYA
jgi:hypothetical protein